jgi:hypothetical protein
MMAETPAMRGPPARGGFQFVQPESYGAGIVVEMQKFG